MLTELPMLALTKILQFLNKLYKAGNGIPNSQRVRVLLVVPRGASLEASKMGKRSPRRWAETVRFFTTAILLRHLLVNGVI